MNEMNYRWWLWMIEKEIGRCTQHSSSICTIIGQQSMAEHMPQNQFIKDIRGMLGSNLGRDIAHPD
jgi:hypothetical protein